MNLRLKIYPDRSGETKVDLINQLNLFTLRKTQRSPKQTENTRPLQTISVCIMSLGIA